MIYKYIILFLVLLSGCGAGSPTATTEPSRDIRDSAFLASYDFLHLAGDTVIDPTGSLQPFFEQLHKLQGWSADSAALVVPIIHYGDSHIQAGFLTEGIMRRLHSHFGNAGRGIVVPHKLAGSNEPRDYRIVSPIKFQSGRVIERNADVTPGATGIAIRSEADPQKMLIHTLPLPEYPEDDYRFNRVVVMHDSLSPMITADAALLSDAYGSDIFYSYTTEIDLLEPTDSLELYTYKERQFKGGAYYGFSLENGKSGVLYHTLGVNGACFLHWGSRDRVAQQSRALSPQLIIISMGTNEASGRNFIESVFYREVDSFVSKLRDANPHAAIVLTTPVESMRRSRAGAYPNTNFAKVQATLQQYAADKGVALIDLYAISGGANASIIWNSYSLLSPDKVHFTSTGYNIQGLLIYNALVHSLNKGMLK